MLPATIILGLYIGTLACAIVSDVTRYVIPNKLVLVNLGAFVLAAGVFYGQIDILPHLYAGAAVLAAGMILFATGKFGGGDAKLLAAAALWVGLDLLPLYLIYVAILGGALSVLLLILRRDGAQVLLAPVVRSGHLSRVLQKGAPIPYGIAIAGAAIAMTGHIPFFRTLLSSHL